MFTARARSPSGKKKKKLGFAGGWVDCLCEKERREEMKSTAGEVFGVLVFIDWEGEM